MPFMATDPSGMNYCIIFAYDDDWGYAGPVYYDSDGNAYATQVIGGGTRYEMHCFGSGENGSGGEAGGSGGDGTSETTNERDPLCDKLADLGITNTDFERMKSDYFATYLGQQVFPGSSLSLGPVAGANVREFGHVARKNGKYEEGTPSNMKVIKGVPIFFGLKKTLFSTDRYSYHTHFSLEGVNEPSKISFEDWETARIYPNLKNFMGYDEGLIYYNYKPGHLEQLAGKGWYNIDCSK
jgi:hypothetical protein